MPTVLREAGYRFHFFSADGDEPQHVHVDGRGQKAKIWLREVRVDKSTGFSDVELARIVRIVSDNRVRLLEAWDEFFG